MDTKPLVNQPIQETTPATPAQPPVQANQPAAPTTPAGPAPKENHSGKPILVVAVLVILFLLVFGGAYFYINYQNKAVNNAQSQQTEVAQQAVNTNDLGSELQNSQIQLIDNDFSPVDKDLQNL